ncbi:CHASE domain-containing protein [Azospirillum sp. B4]|uniref:CHASE domain-containing protein n=1 Tax=Azospirillum sp. B4 TaxID=95605 RepID=UPI0003455DBC|nr:CHASE domain-containing protein [Azospirillum sp. B4]
MVYHRIAAPLIVLVLVLVGGVAAAWLVHGHNRAAAASSLGLRAAELTEDLHQRLNLFQYGLRGARSAIVVAGTDTLTREQFRLSASTRSLDEEFPGALGFGFVRRVAPSAETAFVDRERRSGRDGFRVRQLTAHEGERFIIQYVEPESRNAAAIGLDIASDPDRRLAAVDAMRLGEPRLTAPLTLVQADSRPAQGFLLLLPVYSLGSEIHTPAQRAAATIGWTYVPLLISDVLAKSELIRDDISFTLRDVTDTPDAPPFYTAPATAEGAVEGVSRDEILTVFGRRWMVHFQATPLFLPPLNLTPPWMAATRLAIGGILVSLLLHLYLLNLSRKLQAGEEKAGQAQRLEAEVKARTADLAEREARFKTLTELSTDWYWEADRDGRFTAMSQGVARIGLDPSTLIGKTRRDLSVRADDPRLDHYEEMLHRGEPFRDFGYDLQGDDGTLHHIVVSGTPILDDAGTCVGYRGSGRDVTEQLRADHALLASQRFIRAIADNIPGMVGYWDADLRCRFANKQYREWFGRSPEDIVGCAMRTLLGEHLYQANEPQIAAALTGETQHFERSITKADGSPSDVWVHYMPDIDHGGRVQGFFVLVTDVTPLKRAEQELRMISSRLALATKASGIAVWEFDVRSRHLDWDDQMFQLYGLRRGETSTLDAWRIQCVPEDRARVEDEFRRVLGGGRDLDTEFRIRHPDGSLRHVKAASITERSPDGRPVRVIGVNWDITGIREHEAELLAARATAESASRAKTDFLANMSHEIRTPMNAILGLTHLLQRSELPPDQQDFVTKISTAGRGLLALINDILDFSKIEAGRMDLEHAEFRLPDLLDSLTSMLAVNARDKGLGLSATVAQGTPMALMGDRVRLQQVLVNLAGNAVKFTHTGGVAVRVQHEGWRQGRVILRFTVTDTGIGIPATALPALFSAFTQADTSTTRRYGGSGLGLAISKRLVNLMGGEIGVESQPGSGSIFWFTVPLEPAAVTLESDGGDPNEGMAPPRKPRRGTQPLAGVRLLMVEDNSVNQDVGRLILQAEGAAVDVAADGSLALDRLAATPDAYDLVLMDMQMPVMDGYEATRLIRQQLGLTALPVVALTAGVLDEERDRAYAAGITAFMTKPFEVEQMVSTIRHLVRRPGKTMSGKAGTARS